MLGSMNLAAYVRNPFEKDATFDYVSFREDVRTAVAALNEVLDEGMPLHPLKEQRDSVRDWRQIGLGVFGLADCLIKLNLVYGSKKANSFCEMLSLVMFCTALDKSCELGEELGSYPMFDSESVSASEMITSSADMRTESLKALRNSQLLTIAPTGSLSSMLGVSGGVEPIFANSYTRKTQSLHGEDVFYKVYTPIVKEYMDRFGITDEKDLPRQFVVSADIEPERRIACQSAWQKWIDASISSTINLPNEATVEDVEKIYMQAWKNGLKGVTVYRAGCAREGVLVDSSKQTDKKPAEQKEAVTEHTEQKSDTMPRGYVIPASDNLIGLKRQLTTGCGTLHLLAYFDKDTKELRETYLAKGSTGGCNNFATGLSRMISLAARGGVPLNDIVDQLNSTGVCPSYATRRAVEGNTSPGSCCPMAIGRALLEMEEEIRYGDDGERQKATMRPAQIIKVKHQSSAQSEDKCPTCGAPLQHEGGCVQCKSCGWSRCD